jgi:hypothetical protein
VKLLSKKWSVAFLILLFIGMQLLVAMHRVTHVHGSKHASAVGGHSHSHTDFLHVDHSHADHSRTHGESSLSHAFVLFPDHSTKADCDRFDACAGSDVVAARLNEAQFQPPEAVQLTRIDVAFVAARNFRATARAPPLAAA